MCLYVLNSPTNLSQIAGRPSHAEPRTNNASISAAWPAYEQPPSLVAESAAYQTHHRPTTVPSQAVTSSVVAVKPVNPFAEGLGSILQHYRKSLSYALALGLPWLGTMRNTHDGIDYAETLGLCQPLCANRSNLHGFARMQVPQHLLQMDPGIFKMVKVQQKPTLLLVRDDDLDQGHTQHLLPLRERFFKHSMPPNACPSKPYVTFHFRWGDVRSKSGDFKNPKTLNRRTIPMDVGVGLIQKIQRICNFNVKLLSEGADVRAAFASRFGGPFDYLDGSAKGSSVSEALRAFACSSIIIGGESSFAVLGILLSHSMILAPMRECVRCQVKYANLSNVHDTHRVLEATDPEIEAAFENAVRNAAPSPEHCKH